MNQRVSLLVFNSFFLKKTNRNQFLSIKEKYIKFRFFQLRMSSNERLLSEFNKETVSIISLSKIILLSLYFV